MSQVTAAEVRLAAAQSMLERGWVPIPIPAGRKGPLLADWQNLQPSPDDLPGLFAGPGNIGVVLGEPSGGLVDVDLDCPEALLLADTFLPETGLVHGRPGAPRSHRWYIATPIPETRRYRAPGRSGVTLVELRSTGGQTVVPPSIHPTGEVIDWVDAYGEPAAIDAGHIEAAVAILAGACLLARHWPTGARHDAAMALAGGLARSGWSMETGLRFMAAVARAAGDDESPDRVRAVRDTWRADHSGGKTTGLPTLAKLIPPEVVSKISEWLGLGSDEPSLPMPAPASGSAKPPAPPTTNGKPLPRGTSGIAEAIAALEASPASSVADVLREQVAVLAPRILSGQLSKVLARGALLAAVALPGNQGEAIFDEVLAATPASDDVPRLNHKTPIRTARALLDIAHTSEPDSEGECHRILHRHRQTWYRWRSAAYREVEEEALRADIWDFLERGNVNPSSSRVSNVVDALRGVAYLSDQHRAPCWLGAPPAECPESKHLIPLRNGLLDASTGRLLPPSPRFFTQSALPFDFDPANASPPVAWLEFLEQIWGDDPASIENLQETFGYLLTPDTSIQKMFLLLGPRRSGKGTIARVLRQLLGEENVAGPTLASLGSPFGLAPLIGRSCAIISDARLSGKADQQVIVERMLSITGEDALDVDRKHKNAWTGQLTTRLVVLSNELPRLSDSSSALPGRFVILRLTRSFYGEEDPGLLQRLLPELPRILHWALEGRRRLYARGFFEAAPSSVELHLDLEDLASPIGAFVRDRCELGPSLSTPCGTLYDEWVKWCTEQGRDNPGIVQSFSRDLRSALPELKVTFARDGNRRYRVFNGVSERFFG